MNTHATEQLQEIFKQGGIFITISRAAHALEHSMQRDHTAANMVL